VEVFAEGVIDLVSELGLEHFSLIGHHTGGVVAVEVAATVPERIESLVLSGMPFVDADRRRIVADRPPIDLVEPRPDGSHLTELWANRAPYYPADRPDLLDRLVRDALSVLDRVEEGHEAVNRYRMEDRIGLITGRTLAMCGELDYFSLPDLPKIVDAIPGARSTVLVGTGVPAIDHRPGLVAATVESFLLEGALHA